MTKTPFRLQATKHDCVPTTFLNAIVALFDRDEIPPAVVQRIFLYTLDTISRDREHGGEGTTRSGVQVLTHWLKQYRTRVFKLDATCVMGEEVHLRQNNVVAKTVNAGGVVLLRLRAATKASSWHYILVLESIDGVLQCFDPFPKQNHPTRRHAEFLKELPPLARDTSSVLRVNLRLRSRDADSVEDGISYVLGPFEEREAVVMHRRS